MADDFFSEEVRRELVSTSVELERLGDLADGVGRSLSRAFRGAVLEGKSLNGVLADIARSFRDIALNAALRPVELFASSAIESLFKATNPALQPSGNDAIGGLFAAASPIIRPHAKGGVIAAPSYFPLEGGLGLMGEAGPEAILPLRRGSDGSLGVAATGGGTVNVTMHVTAQDARSFVAAEAEVSAMLLRAVRRGTRAS